VLNVTTAKPVPLLVRPQPLTGESWGGFLARVAAANQVGGLRDLSSLLGLTEQRLLVGDPIASLAALGIEWSEGVSFMPSRTGALRRRATPTHFGRSFRFRACPHCLRDDSEPFIRTCWELPLSLICDRHDVLLLERCQHCGRELDYRHCSPTRCRCGSALALQRAIAPPHWVGDISRVFREAQPLVPSSTFGAATPVSQQAARIWPYNPFFPESLSLSASTRLRSYRPAPNES